MMILVEQQCVVSQLCESKYKDTSSSESSSLVSCLLLPLFFAAGSRLSVGLLDIVRSAVDLGV